MVRGSANLPHPHSSLRLPGQTASQNVLYKHGQPQKQKNRGKDDTYRPYPRLLWSQLNMEVTQKVLQKEQGK